MALKQEQMIKVLLESLIGEIEKKKIIKHGFVKESFLYDLFNLNNNRKSRLLQNSSELFLPNSIDSLVEQNLVQQLDVNGHDKYALSFLGISYALELMYGYEKIEQFSDFLDLSDKRYQKITVTGELNWREELALVTLLFLGCVSLESAMNLNNPLNRENFEKLLETNIVILEKNGIFEKQYELPETRGEPRSALFMRSRINDLARKTNHLYKNIGRGEGYYLDLLENERVNVEKTHYLLKKIIGKYNPSINYTELKNDLVENARAYQAKFLSVRFESGNMMDLLDTISDFFDRQIWDLI